MKSKYQVFAIGLLFGLPGCVLLSELFQDDYSFSHKLHIQDEDLECLDCHIYAEDEEDPGMPRLKQCNLCHKEIDQELPEEQRVAVFYEAGKYIETCPRELSDEVIFSHVEHVDKYEEDCTVCHLGIDENERPGQLDELNMVQCVSCHEDERVEGDACAVCHQEVDRDWSPAGHGLGWELLHGDVSRGLSEATANDCTLCHSEQTCDVCHQTEQPKSHGDYFRKRGHGLRAQIDRDNCAACHTPDYCDRCHQVAEPINHSGIFGGTQSTHCIGCHFPVQGESCYTCHKDTPSHMTAAPLPGDHNPGMNCRQCHGVDQPLPHVDKGDSCINCHM